ncbi:MAG: hypothetical protein OXR72_00850 [Gemmatimonadota bacterium]|nr:hypothetical protein [Gemmatimonadota bacterium]
MKIKTSITLSEGLVRDMDSLLKAPDTPKNRSAFLEAALRQYVALLRRRIRDARDTEILDRKASALNDEANDVLSYQVDL